MSQDRQTLRKLLAFEAKQALPKYSTIHYALPDHPAFLAFVRMSGETRPWGIAFGTRAEGPKIYSVTDGRDRSEIQEMLEEFAIDFLNFFQVENFTFEPISTENLRVENPPQLWLPNSSHIDMLHFMNYMYWRTRDTDQFVTHRAALSRLCGWLFRESTFAGQQLVIDSAKALRDSFVFPTDEVTISNPAAGREWLVKKASIEQHVEDSRKFSQEAAGTTLQPDVEKKLEPLLKDKEANAVDITFIITEELERRWSLAADAFQDLKSGGRPANQGTEALLKKSLERYVYDFQYKERKKSDEANGPTFTQHPETDNHGSAAAAGYFKLQAADSRLVPTLIHHDEELLKDALFEGKAIAGNLMEIYEEPRGPKSKDVYWVIRVSLHEDFRIREGDRMSPFGNPTHMVQIQGVNYLDDNEVDLTLHWSSGKTRGLGGENGAKVTSDRWITEKFYFVPSDSSSFDDGSSTKVWKAREGRGAWLTHGSSTISPDADVIDDVQQLEGN